MKAFIFIILYIAPFVALAQDRYTAVLQRIETNNTTLAALREQTEAQKIENRTGIYISNPEVEFNYLWGNPTAIGRRILCNFKFRPRKIGRPNSHIAGVGDDEFVGGGEVLHAQGKGGV